MNDKKIIKFPEHRIVREATHNIEELKKAKEKSIINFAEGLIHDLTGTIYSEFENNGVETDGEKFETDFSFMVDSLRSCVYRTLGISHAMHDFIDTSVEMKPFDRKKGRILADDEVIENEEDIDSDFTVSDTEDPRPA